MAKSVSIPMAALRFTLYHMQTLLLFTGDQLFDTVIPGSAFAIFAALSGHVLGLPEQPTLAILSRLPLVSGWLWLVVFQFCLQNQRNSIEEDAINKPWRPMPSKRISRTQMTYLFASIYVMAAVVSYFLGVFPIFVVYTMLVITYNDLGGSDHSGTTRNLFCGAGFSCYFSGALSIAISPTGSIPIGYSGWKWTLLITHGVLATTIQTQELRDEAGDRARGRHTLVTELGRKGTLWTVIITVPFWSLYLPLGFFEGGWLTAVLPATLGGCLVATAFQAMYCGSNSLDRRMYKIWCLWMFGLCPLPILNALVGHST
jgi:4-hydroxybenzoate polyprenyltransferase